MTTNMLLRRAALAILCGTCFVQAMEIVEKKEKKVLTVEEMAKKCVDFCKPGGQIYLNNNKGEFLEEISTWLINKCGTPAQLEEAMFDQLKKVKCESSGVTTYTNLYSQLVDKNNPQLDTLIELIDNNDTGFSFPYRDKRRIPYCVRKWSQLCKENDEQKKEAFAKRLAFWLELEWYEAEELEVQLLQANNNDTKNMLDLAKRVTKLFKHVKFSLAAKHYDQPSSPNIVFCFFKASANFYKKLFYSAAVLPQFVAGLSFGALAHDYFYSPDTCINKKNLSLAGFGLAAMGIGRFSKWLFRDKFEYANGHPSVSMKTVNNHMAPALFAGAAVSAVVKRFLK